MKSSITLYDALTSISIPSGQSKAVVDAWENEVKDLASKSDLQKTERQLNTAICGLGSELRALIREQGVELRSSIREQGVELKSSIMEQGVDLKASISTLEARHKIINWQFGIIFICVSLPTIKLGYDFLSRAFPG